MNWVPGAGSVSAMGNNRIKADSDDLYATITQAQSVFLDQLTASGEVATDRSGVVQHLIAAEIERRTVQNRMPPKVVTVVAEEQDKPRRGKD